MKQKYKKVCLLQPTSPLRTAQHIFEAYALWTNELEMVVSMYESKSNPYFNLFEEDQKGFLQKSKVGVFFRRQEVPIVWRFNEAIYLMNIDSVKTKNPGKFQQIRKYVLNYENSVDVDTSIDFLIASELIKQRNVE